MSVTNAFTVDVEDYFQVSAFADCVPESQWPMMESRVERNTFRILELLDQYRVRGTFFIVGWTADRHPALVREIADRGHEIGTHSYWHRLVYRQTPQEFREDLRRSIDVIEEIVAAPVQAYRAPSFSITKESTWALPILAEEGIRFDSSVFPVVHDRYGIPDANPLPHMIEFPDSDNTLCEFPPSVHRCWKVNLPVSGGGYFRLYPLRVTLSLLSRINRKLRAPFMFYIHPWELDPDQPRIRAGFRSRFRHYQNLKATESKLHGLLRQLRFGTLSGSWRDHIESQSKTSTPAIV